MCGLLILKITTPKENNMPKIEYDNIDFDSVEELEFYHWCVEAKNKGIILGFIYQPPSYTLSTKKTYTVPKQLKTKIRYDEKTLLRPHVYTADFMLYSEPGTNMDKFPNYIFIGSGGEILIDVKGTFNMYGGDRELSINQKWLYDKFDIYVNKVVPEKLFKATWVPEKVRYTPKTGKLRKKYEGCLTIKERV